MVIRQTVVPQVVSLKRPGLEVIKRGPFGQGRVQHRQHCRVI